MHRRGHSGRTRPRGAEGDKSSFQWNTSLNLIEGKKERIDMQASKFAGLV